MKKQISFLSFLICIIFYLSTLGCSSGNSSSTPASDSNSASPTSPTDQDPISDPDPELPSEISISGVSPAVINTLGGAPISISGTGFSSGMTFSIGGEICSNPTVTSTTEASCVLPALSLGQKTLIATHASNTASLTDAVNVKSFLLTGEAVANTVLLYEVNSTSGALTLLSSRSSSGSSPRNFILGKNRLAFVLNSSNARISVYTINFADGSLTEVTGSPVTVAGCTSLKGGALSPDNSLLVVTCESTNNLFVYQVNSEGALTLTAGSPYSAASARTASFSADGSNLFVTGYSGNLNMFNVSSNGLLTSFAGSPFAVTGLITGSAVFGNYFYSPRWSTNTVFQYSYDSTGISALSPASVLTGQSSAYSISFSPNGKWSVVPSENTTGLLLNLFSRNSMTGTLTAASGSPYSTGAALNLRHGQFDTTSGFLYVFGNNSSVLGYSVNDTTGELTGLAGFPMTLTNGGVYHADIK